MTKYYRLTIIFLLLTLLSQSVFIEAEAFFICKRNECQQKSEIHALTVLDNPTNSDSSDIYIEPNNTIPVIPQLPDPSSKNNSNNNSSPILPNSNSGLSKTCSANLNAFSVKKAFALCQIQTAITKAKNITFLVSVLQGTLSRLLRLMKKAPVCTDQGITLEQYYNNYSISGNLANLKSLNKSLQALLDRLNKINFACADCEDGAALASALASLDSVLAELQDLIAEFNNELDEINNRLENFISKIIQVISAHSTSIEGIMLECGVNPFIARKMRRARLKALDAFIKFVDQKKELFKKIDDENLGTHDCQSNDDADLELTLVCNDLKI